MPCFSVNRCFVSVEGLHDLSQDLLAGDFHCFPLLVEIELGELLWTLDKILEIFFLSFLRLGKFD